ncbi:M16 family metallopeptidase [Sphingomonas sp. Leaf67]|uniref:M16 family metallopeptidase n=1 Tax=Sphingomonas sp. Leaf67 TaxID=1736230 RepID=UPI000ACC6592|nr:insulinase family protein [Sphingomonas sp. Leaf67]
MPLSRHCLALLLATATPLPAIAQHAVAVAHPIRFDVERFTLPNGLTVLVHSNRRNPNIFVGVYYRVGAKDEPRGRSGFAHLFEHLMFQPTANRTGDYLVPMTTAGARDVNASTLADYTEYHQTVPTNALDLALWLESDRMAHLTGGLTQRVLDEQRAVIKNEASQTPTQVSRPEQRFQRDFYTPGHPYTRPVIGTTEDLEAATLDEVKAWHRTYYGAGNAILVLSGDIDVATARARVGRYFADVPRGPVPPRIAAPVPTLTATRRVVYHEPVATPVITRVWSIDPRAARDMTLLQLAGQTMTLPGPRSLQSALVGEGKPAVHLSAQLDPGQLSTVFSLSMTVRPNVSVATAEAALDAAIARYLAQGPEQRQLSAIAALTDQSLLRDMQDNVNVGLQMAVGALYMDDPATLLRQRDWTAGATSAQLREVAGRWLSRPFYQQTILPGEPEPLPPAAPAPDATLSTATPTTADPTPVVDRSRMPEIGPFKDKVPFPKIIRTRLANGMTLIVAERHDLPIVDVDVRFPVGTQANHRYAPGAVQQAFGWMSAGTTHADEARLTSERERSAIVLDAHIGATTSDFTWSTLTRNVDAGFALAADMLRNPVYPQSRIDAYNQGASARLAAYAAQPQGAAGLLLANALWGDGPGGKLPDPGGLRPLTRTMLTDFHRRELGGDGATLLVMGDITPAEAHRLAERHFGDWRRNAPAAVPVMPAPAAAPRIILVDAPGAPQSQITIGQLVPPHAIDRRPAEVIADMTLAGEFDSRINANLRQGKSWTYGFEGSIADTAHGPRAFSATGAIETDRTADAMREIQRELTAFVTTRPITATELKARRSAAIRAVPAGLNGDAAVMQAILRANDHGRPLDDAGRAGDALAKVTLETVNRVARETFRPGAMTWIVVGDLATIEASIRGLNLAPVEVRDVYGRRLR